MSRPMARCLTVQEIIAQLVRWVWSYVTRQPATSILLAPVRSWALSRLCALQARQSGTSPPAACTSPREPSSRGRWPRRHGIGSPPIPLRPPGSDSPARGPAPEVWGYAAGVQSRTVNGQYGRCEKARSAAKATDHPKPRLPSRPRRLALPSADPPNTRDDTSRP